MRGLESGGFFPMTEKAYARRIYRFEKFYTLACKDKNGLPHFARDGEIRQLHVRESKSR
jgi:hypothetical protein